MGMSPSRMPQTQGMMGSHANNMVAQPTNQGQFLPQGQFTAAAGGAMNVNVGLGQPITQAAVTQVRIFFFPVQTPCGLLYMNVVNWYANCTSVFVPAAAEL